MKDNSQYIDDYISGALNEEEMEDFEGRKGKEPELEQEYQIFAKSREFLKARAMIHEIENDPDLTKAEEIVNTYYEQVDADARRRSKIRKGLLISLSAAAVLTGFILIMSYLSNSNPLSRMYAKYYIPLKTEEIQHIIVRDASNPHLSEGLEYYLRGNYSIAIDRLIQANNAHFFIGLSYMELEEYYQAEKYLVEFYENNTYHPGANWYLGLTYLKLNKTDKAIIHFRNLFLLENSYQTSAERILRKLEKYRAAEEF